MGDSDTRRPDGPDTNSSSLAKEDTSSDRRGRLPDASAVASSCVKGDPLVALAQDVPMDAGNGGSCDANGKKLLEGATPSPPPKLVTLSATQQLLAPRFDPVSVSPVQTDVTTHHGFSSGKEPRRNEPQTPEFDETNNTSETAKKLALSPDTRHEKAEPEVVSRSPAILKRTKDLSKSGGPSHVRAVTELAECVRDSSALRTLPRDQPGEDLSHENRGEKPPSNKHMKPSNLKTETILEAASSQRLSVFDKKRYDQDRSTSSRLGSADDNLEVRCTADHFRTNLGACSEAIAERKNSSDNCLSLCESNGAGNDSQTPLSPVRETQPLPTSSSGSGHEPVPCKHRTVKVDVAETTPKETPTLNRTHPQIYMSRDDADSACHRDGPVTTRDSQINAPTVSPGRVSDTNMVTAAASPSPAPEKDPRSTKVQKRSALHSADLMEVDCSSPGTNNIKSATAAPVAGPVTPDLKDAMDMCPGPVEAHKTTSPPSDEAALHGKKSGLVITAKGSEEGNDAGNEPAPASRVQPVVSSERPLQPMKSGPQARKRGRSPPSVPQRSMAQAALPRESMLNKAFSGRVELSAYCGHRIVVHVGGQELTGWVLDADVSSMENSEHIQEQPTTEATKEEGNTLTSFPTDRRRKPRKLPVARRARRVVPLTKDPDMKIDDMTCAPGLITGADVPKRSVIVIGAGIAGVAAARALTDRGFQVTVLEARRRAGGRIATDWSMGCPVDLGAAFIHGCYGNPLSEIAREGDLRTYSPSDINTLVYANGQRVNPSDDRHAEHVWKALLRRAESIARGSLMKHLSLDIALGKLLNRLKEEVVDGCSEELSQLLAWHAANLEAACASEMKDLSAMHYDMDDKSGFSGSHKLVRDGYSSIVYALARNLDIHYSSEVVAIQRNVPIHLAGTDKLKASKGSRPFGSKKYQEALLRDVHAEGQIPRSVRYLDGVKKKETSSSEISTDVECTTQMYGVRVIAKNGKEYVAEACIVTLPLGVLQKDDVTFSPPLPAWKRDAIHNVGFGLVNKVVLRFSSPFWVNGLSTGEDDDTNQTEGPDQIGRVSDEHGVFYMFLSLLRCAGAPILVAITSGRFAEHLERLSDEEVVKMALEALRNMFPSKPIGTLLSHCVTRWKTDRYARGSYSYAKVGTTPRDYTKISEPLGVLSFAGEATHRDHPATAHGAFMSGIREAARIIERSDFSEDDRRQYARELFLMQEPHASFEKAVTCNGGTATGKKGGNPSGMNRHLMTNGGLNGIANGNAPRRKK